MSELVDVMQDHWIDFALGMDHAGNPNKDWYCRKYMGMCMWPCLQYVRQVVYCSIIYVFFKLVKYKLFRIPNMYFIHNFMFNYKLTILLDTNLYFFEQSMVENGANISTHLTYCNYVTPMSVCKNAFSNGWTHQNSKRSTGGCATHAGTCHLIVIVPAPLGLRLVYNSPSWISFWSISTVYQCWEVKLTIVSDLHQSR